jgi:hypothetical protein
MSTRRRCLPYSTMHGSTPARQIFDKFVDPWPLCTFTHSECFFDFCWAYSYHEDLFRCFTIFRGSFGLIDSFDLPFVCRRARKSHFPERMRWCDDDTVWNLKLTMIDELNGMKHQAVKTMPHMSICSMGRTAVLLAPVSCPKPWLCFDGTTEPSTLTKTDDGHKTITTWCQRLTKAAL